MDILLQTARDILSQDPQSSSHLGGLWVLLISKAAGVNRKFDMDANFIQGIHQKQRTLAETTELINTAFLLHRSMVDLTEEIYDIDTNKKGLDFGNKLFILGGDYLLSRASLELAKIENTDVVALIGRSIGDMAEGGNINDIDVSNWTVQSWEDFIFLMKGSLMANSCKSSAKVVGHSADTSQLAYEFGKNLVFAQHCHDDHVSFLDKKQFIKRTNYVLITAIQNSPEIRTFLSNNGDVWTDLEVNNDLKALILHIQPDINMQVENACEFYIKQCLKKITSFSEVETVKAIETILRSIAKP